MTPVHHPGAYAFPARNAPRWWMQWLGLAVVLCTSLASTAFADGGPVVEATHGRLGFTAPLSAITAAVVGVDRKSVV